MTDRFAYREHDPGPQLRPYIRCLWTLSGNRPTTHPPERIVPDGSMELVFNFGDCFCHFPNGGAPRSQPRQLLVGQITGPMLIAPTGRVDTLGIRFRPGGVARFFREPADELTGQTVDLPDAHPRGGGFVLERLAEQPDVETRVRGARRALVNTLGAPHGPDDLVLAAVRTIERAGGRISVETLARLMGVTRRHLERGFVRRVGIGPKLLARITRFQRVFRALGTGMPQRWAGIAHACGYFDQAHLIRDFRAFTGLSPAAYLGSDHTLADLFTGIG